MQSIPQNAKPLSAASEAKLKSFFQLGLQHGCSRDQLLNLSNVGLILQARQLAACAAARLCDQPDGPRAVGYGGARGGGKTHWLLAQMGADDCQRRADLNCLLLRKVGKSNLENFETMRQRLFARLPHEFNASRGILTFANGSRITLGHYQCEKDIDNYLGLEYDVIGLEEATQLSLRKYEDISTCCRTSKPDWRPRIYSTTNPGGIGHPWYFDKFIVPHQSGLETDTRFIPARVDDNAFINPGYKADLARLTGWQHDAWYEGLWNFPNGQYFRNFSPRLHVLKADFRPPSGAEWFAAMDYGYTHPTVVLLGCRDAAGTIYVLDEHVERFWIPARHAQAIKSMLARHEIFCSQDHLRVHLLARFPNACSERDALWRQFQQRRMLAGFVAGSDAFGTESRGDTVPANTRNWACPCGLPIWIAWPVGPPSPSTSAIPTPASRPSCSSIRAARASSVASRFCSTISPAPAIS